MALFIDLNIQNSLPNHFILEDSEALKQAIISFINTSPGEFLFEPDLGSSILDYLYSPANYVTQSDLEFILNDQLTQYFSFLDISSKVVINNNQLTVYINYTDPFTKAKQSIPLSLDS